MHVYNSCHELRSRAINQGIDVLENIFEINFCLMNKLQNRIQRNVLAQIQKLARIMQESCKFLNSSNFVCEFLAAKTNWKPKEMTAIRIFDQQKWTYLTFFVNAILNMKSCKIRSRFLQDFEFKYNFPTTNN